MQNEDVTSQIVEHDIMADNEIPFESFYTAIKNDMALNYDIAENEEEV